MAVLDDPRTQSLGTDLHLLFPEARQRRRRRLLLGGLILCVALSLGATFFAAGGSGRFFGGPPATSSSRGPSGGLVTHQPLPAGHGPTSSGPAICNKGILSLVPPNTKASASLLPCYKAPNLPGPVSTITPP
jgi:hypothetical protein